VTEAELEALRSVFALFDTDGTGEIDSKEFATILSKVGRDPAEGTV
jgi:Ca2+-binding EF-hand superfamily protein